MVTNLIRRCTTRWCIRSKQVTIFTWRTTTWLRKPWIRLVQFCKEAHLLSSNKSGIPSPTLERKSYSKRLALLNISTWVVCLPVAKDLPSLPLPIARRIAPLRFRCANESNAMSQTSWFGSRMTSWAVILKGTSLRKSIRLEAIGSTRTVGPPDRLSIAMVPWTWALCSIHQTSNSTTMARLTQFLGYMTRACMAR